MIGSQEIQLSNVVLHQWKVATDCVVLSIEFFSISRENIGECEIEIVYSAEIPFACLVVASPQVGSILAPAASGAHLIVGAVIPFEISIPTSMAGKDIGVIIHEYRIYLGCT